MEPTQKQASEQRDAGDAVGRPVKSLTEELSGWYRLTGVGIEFIVAVLLFGGLGYLADRWLGTRPWMMVVGGGLGFAVGLYMLVRAANKTFKH
ncbi:MAG TPA: AtpZ/AtpI family protein [Tepidisphaeraceae bacterium]|nr:AtpZ/AtpI family protein [Tepidisphaeraceae bacterium]